jgi:hypothetical protein
MLPRNLRPLRLSRRSEPFDSDDFIYELKIDGLLICLFAYGFTDLPTGDSAHLQANPLSSWAAPNGAQRRVAPRDGTYAGGRLMSSFAAEVTSVKVTSSMLPW